MAEGAHAPLQGFATAKPALLWGPVMDKPALTSRWAWASPLLTAAAGGVVLCLALCASPARAQMSPEDEALNFPRGDGVSLNPYASSSPIRAGGRLWDVTFSRPTGWLLHHDGTSWLLQPADPNPGDLGVIILVTPTDGAPPALTALSDPSAWEALLSSVSRGAHLQSHTLTPRPAALKGSPNEVSVAQLDGQFDSGLPARWLAMTWERDGVRVTAIAGAADRAFSPFQGLLQDLLLSIELQPR